MDIAPGVAAALIDAGEKFGPPLSVPPEPRWGVLYTTLDAGIDPGFAVAIELIYEGYLLHYRESRAVSLEADNLAARLLAGDYFYARGLRGIAARGDIDAVGLLARLMAACSYLRGSRAPFADDDALWAYTMGGLAAQHAGAEPAAVAALFDEVDAALGGSRQADVPAAVTRAAGRLGLADASPLLRALDTVAGPATADPTPTTDIGR